MAKRIVQPARSRGKSQMIMSHDQAIWAALVVVLEPIYGIDAMIIASLVAIAIACGLASLVPPEASHIAEAIVRATRPPAPSSDTKRPGPPSPDRFPV